MCKALDIGISQVNVEVIRHRGISGPSQDIGLKNIAGKAAAQKVHDEFPSAMRRHAIQENRELPATR